MDDRERPNQRQIKHPGSSPNVNVQTSATNANGQIGLDQKRNPLGW